MDTTRTKENPASVQLIHAHICPICDRASRRDDSDGLPDAAGVFHCSQCGSQGPLNEAVIEESDERLRR
jgi:ribosomal protein L37AE/L43A